MMININSFLQQKYSQHNNPTQKQIQASKISQVEQNAQKPQEFFSESIMAEEKKTICFVISDEEIFFNKQTLINYSQYIQTLVKDLDPSKNVRILLPKWMTKMAFVKFLQFIQDHEIKAQESNNMKQARFIVKGSQQSIDKKLEGSIVHNLLQIADFFQCKAAIDFCIQNLEITPENAQINIKEALKKIQNCQKQNNSNCKDCWFTLIQRSINGCAVNISNLNGLQELTELKNSYVTKEVLERYFKHQIINGIKSSSVFEKAVEILKDIKGSSQAAAVTDFIQFTVSEGEIRKQQAQQKKKSYIDWNVQLKPNQNIYNSDPVRIDELDWKFTVQVDHANKEFQIFVGLLSDNDSSASILNKQISLSPQNQKSYEKYVKRNSQSQMLSYNNSQKSISQQRPQTSTQKKHSNQNQSQSYMHSINRLANKQRQPNQNKGQKNENANLSMSNQSSHQNIPTMNNSYRQTSDSKVNSSNSSNQNLREAKTELINSQSLSTSNSRLQISQCSQIRHSGFPITVLAEVQLQQNFKQSEQLQMQYFTLNPLSSQLLTKIKFPENFATTGQQTLKIIFRVDFVMTAFQYYSASNLRRLYQLPSIAKLCYQQFRTLIKSDCCQVDSEDHILHMILFWQRENPSYQLNDLLELLNWSLLSEEHLSYLYQNYQIIDRALLRFVKDELIQRNLITNTFEAILQEKVQEISTLKNELEKYKMGEKIAASILESPFSYSSNTQEIRRRKRQGSYLNMTANFDQQPAQDILDHQSYTSHNSNGTFQPGTFSDTRSAIADGYRYSIPKSDIHLDNFDRNSFYVSEKAIESYNSTPNNFDVRVDNFNQQNKSSRPVSEQARPEQDSSVKRTLAINLNQLAQQIDQQDNKSALDQSHVITQNRHKHINLDNLIGQSQKMIVEQRSLSQHTQKNITPQKAAQKLKEVLEKTNIDKINTNIMATAATSKLNSRCASDTQAKTTIHTKTTSHMSSTAIIQHADTNEKYQTIPANNNNNNLEKLGQSDISIKHSFFAKLDNQSKQKLPQDNNNQKGQNLDLQHINVSFNQNCTPQAAVNNPNSLINHTFLERFRLQPNNPSIKTNGSSQIPSLGNQTNNSYQQQQQQQSLQNTSVPQKRQPRFIIKKQSN
ncbi:UNKNOWN [Stylonychia lemnae]|uniref:BACK domain-containing protein n=1 Tax=Stylonychia lemnae TaxID=5949 RepID=A0A078AVM0_STYLE|nr:UNKNOWN [Stylonychia lemnae]|eukprot:CDW86420.1 UNKNOWN [Stylonychia lemnae]